MCARGIQELSAVSVNLKLFYKKYKFKMKKNKYKILKAFRELKNKVK